MPSQPIIHLSDVTKTYTSGIFAGVQHINLKIETGNIVSIVGRSGSGKSTLLKLIYGLLAPDTGSVSFKGEPVPGPHEKLIPGHQAMKMVTQDFSLNTYAKVYDNIASMLPNTDLKAKHEETVEMMEFLRIDHLAQKRVVDLSGGEQQRAAIARAIITEPQILLLDEPFSQIDPMLKNELRDDIRRLSRYLGITIILVSHDPADGLSLADQLVVLKEGKKIEEGRPERIYYHPEQLYTAQLLASANVITPEEAGKIGINSSKKVVIYPEWLHIEESQYSQLFHIKDILFKGFYEELILQKNETTLRALNFKPGRIEKGSLVPVSLSRFLEF